jgi:hypothetical protein
MCDPTPSLREYKRGTYNTNTDRPNFSTFSHPRPPIFVVDVVVMVVLLEVLLVVVVVVVCVVVVEVAVMVVVLDVQTSHSTGQSI